MKHDLMHVWFTKKIKPAISERLHEQKVTRTHKVNMQSPYGEMSI